MIDDFRGASNKGKRQRAKLDTKRRRGTSSQHVHNTSYGPRSDILPEPRGFTAAPINLQSTDGDKEPPFRTPEEINGVYSSAIHESQGLLPEHSITPQKKSWAGMLGFFRKKPSKKQAIIMSVAVVVLVSGTTWAVVFNKADAPAPKPLPAKVAPKPKPKPILSPLTGLPVTVEQQARPVTGVMIENSADARPQSGLKDAGVIFEAIAEYGVTRFMALFQESNPANVGPVRSARPYFLDWAMAFDANYAHVGGSPDALQRIKDIGVRDLDQFFNSSAYWRVTTRFAPHNMYTSIDKLVETGNNKGYTKSTFAPLIRKEKEQPAKIPTAKSIDFGISGAFYNSHYDYDAATNAYKRTMGGSPHTDNESGAQLTPKVVVALAMPYSLMDDGYHSMYETTGTGSMLVFQDGVVIPGTWSKADAKSQFVFTDAANAPLKLNPGQTWFTVLSDISKATYAP